MMVTILGVDRDFQLFDQNHTNWLIRIIISADCGCNIAVVTSRYTYFVFTFVLRVCYMQYQAVGEQPFVTHVSSC